MEVAKLAAPPNLEVRFVSCNESAIKRWLSSELEETVFSLTHELFMTKHHTVTLNTRSYKDRKRQKSIFNVSGQIGRSFRARRVPVSRKGVGQKTLLFTLWRMHVH